MACRNSTLSDRHGWEGILTDSSGLTPPSPHSRHPGLSVVGLGRNDEPPAAASHEPPDDTGFRFGRGAAPAAADTPPPSRQDGARPGAHRAQPVESHRHTHPVTPRRDLASTGIPRTLPPSIGDVVLRAAVNVGIPVFLTGPTEDGMPMLWANGAFERYAGVRFSDFAGFTVRRLGEMLVAPVELERMTELVNAGQEVNATVRAHVRGGTHGWAQLTLTPVRAGHSDRITHWVGFSVDV